MQRREWLGWALAPVGTALVGCAAPLDNVDPNAGNLSVVAGHIDMRDAPSPLRWVSIKAYGPGTDHHYRTRVEDGLFFHIAVDPGSYQVDRFGGASTWAALGGAMHEYEWGTQGRNPTALRIERPGVYFVGSYRYVPQRTGIFEPGKFRMEPVNTPGQREVLQRVLRVVEGDASLRVYTKQIERIKLALAA